jgi:cytochrome c oxidase cbb3-type subunit 3
MDTIVSAAFPSPKHAARGADDRAPGGAARRCAPRSDVAVLLALLSALVTLGGCAREDSTKRYVPPDQVLSFDVLYGQNCAGCHGRDGRMGPAPPLNDPLFLTVIDEDQLRQVASAGRPGTLMPAFSEQHGSSLTSEQVERLVTGIRERWGAAPAGEAPLPRYAVSTAPATAGDVQAGGELFRTTCARCHGRNGQGKDAGALHNAAFLSLVSRQLVRRIVITGRPDLGMPDYRKLGEKSPRHQPLTNAEITDIVSFVESWRNVGNENAPSQTTMPSTARSQP